MAGDNTAPERPKNPQQEEYARNSYDLMIKISGACEGRDMNVVASVLTRILAKLIASIPDPNGLKKIIASLEAFYAEELNEKKNAN